jgi:hypothetical protein
MVARSPSAGLPARLERVVASNTARGRTVQSSILGETATAFRR